MSRVYRALVRADGDRHRAPATVLDGPARARGAERETQDEYERLASKILHARAATRFETVMIVSPEHGEGSSTVARRVAQCLSGRAHFGVVLVDANFRTPALHDPRRDGAAPGLVDAVAGRAALETAIVETGTPRLRLLPAGDIDDASPRLLESPRLVEMLGALAAGSDLVVVDGPPVLPYADALTLAAKVDRVILVTQAHRTQRGDLQRAIDELTIAGATILGVVLNRTASHAPPWLQRRLNL